MTATFQKITVHQINPRMKPTFFFLYLFKPQVPVLLPVLKDEIAFRVRPCTLK